MCLARRSAYILKSLSVLLLGILPINKNFAQMTEPSTSFIQLTGSITLTSDFYNYSSTDSTRTGRRPPSLYRLLFSPVLQFGDILSLPFNIILSVPETNTITPSTKNPTIAQYLENPANAFGFSSF